MLWKVTLFSVYVIHLGSTDRVLTLFPFSGGGSTTISPVHDGYVLQKVCVLLDLIIV